MSNEQVTFVFNDQSITMDKGLPVLEAALRIGAHVPHFCYHKNLSIVGQCRACLVEVLDAGNGRPIPKLQASCATPAAEGMVVSSVTTARHRSAGGGIRVFTEKPPARLSGVRSGR